MTRIITHFAIILFCFFLFYLRAMSQPSHVLLYCSQPSKNLTQTNSYRPNRDTILSTFRNRSSLGSYYSNATVGLSPNTVYGMFFCIGNISRTSCSDCVNTGTLEIAKACKSRDEALILNEECMVRYSNISFISLVEKTHSGSIRSLESSQLFIRTLPRKLDELILKASSSFSSPIPYFAEDEERVTQLEGSYNLKAMVQCSPDLVPSNCTICLRLVVQELFECCSQALWARSFIPKCVIKYNISALQPSLGNTKGMEVSWITLTASMTAMVFPLMAL